MRTQIPNERLALNGQLGPGALGPGARVQNTGKKSYSVEEGKETMNKTAKRTQNETAKTTMNASANPQ